MRDDSAAMLKLLQLQLLCHFALPAPACAAGAQSVVPALVPRRRPRDVGSNLWVAMTLAAPPCIFHYLPASKQTRQKNKNSDLAEPIFHSYKDERRGVGGGRERRVGGGGGTEEIEPGACEREREGEREKG